MNGFQTVPMNYCSPRLAATHGTIKKSVSNKSSHPLKTERQRRESDELPLAKEIEFCTTILPHTHKHTRSSVPHSVAFSLSRWPVRFCPPPPPLPFVVPLTWTPCLSVSCHSPYQSLSCLVLFNSSSVHIKLRRAHDQLRLPWHTLSFPHPVVLPDVISSTPTPAVLLHSAGTLSTCRLLTLRSSLYFDQ